MQGTFQMVRSGDILLLFSRLLLFLDEMPSLALAESPRASHNSHSNCTGKSSVQKPKRLSPFSGTMVLSPDAEYNAQYTTLPVYCGHH